MTRKLTSLEVKCPDCSHYNKKTIAIYHPKEFSEDGKQSVLSQFWCQKCDAAVAFRYKFKEKKDVITPVFMKYIDIESTAQAPRPKIKLTARARGR